MPTLHLIDGSNVVRRKLESGSRVLREIYNETLALPADTIPIWCWEGYHAKEARRAYHPGYKMQRVAPPDGTYEVMKTARELLGHTRALQCAVPHREADDVIGHLANAYAGAMPIFIQSNDSDFTQLCTLPNVTVEKQAKVPADFLRLYKATVGDPGDGVPGIKGFGQGGWEKIDDLHAFAHRYQAWLAGGAWRDFPELRPGSNKWLQDNRGAAAAYWTIVGFLAIEPEIAAENTKTGTPNHMAARAILTEFMQ